MTHSNLFGMFIHWGIYSMTSLHEQAFARYNLPRSDYEAFAKEFNPYLYNPEDWVLLAKECGMQYICFTTKHHDGFCMWDTQYSDYSIMHTPYGKDVLKMLADACQKHNMKLSLYYSLPDWHHPKGYNPAATHQWKAINQNDPDFATYCDYVKNQITELLTNYGPIYTFFWDIPPRIEDPSFNAYIRSLQPGILINNRGFDKGDFSTPEREYDEDGSNKPFASMTEACNSIDVQSWGFRENTTFYSYRFLLSSIDRVMARGGSYLLNIGPKSDGTLDPVHVDRMRKIGAWYQKMEGCLENHEADPFDYGFRYCGSCIPTIKNGNSYFHFFDSLVSDCVALARFPQIPKAIRCLNNGKQLPYCVEVLPDTFDGNTGIAKQEFLHIRNIPTDDYPHEPIVLEISWN